MKFIVIEGLDGSGKSTQIKLLREFLNKNNIKHEFLHFPRTDLPWYGELVSMFLRGDLGANNMVNPYLVATIYAGDRTDAKKLINKWLENDILVVVDRYVLSNIAFQCAKIKTEKNKVKLAEWIDKFEYDYNKIPKPNLNIFLDVPFDFTIAKLKNEREGDDRNYLNGQKDIHEESLDFQSEVRKIYLQQIKKNKDFIRIECFDNFNQILSPNNIFEKIINCLKENKILT